MQARLEQVLAGDFRSRIASLLLHELAGHARVVNFTQQTIADLLGGQRTGVSRALHDLQREGVVDIGYGYISVRDVAGLAKAAGVHAPSRAIA